MQWQAVASRLAVMGQGRIFALPGSVNSFVRFPYGRNALALSGKTHRAEAKSAPVMNPCGPLEYDILSGGAF